MQSTTETEVTASQLSKGDWLRLFWGFFWRGIIYMLASGIVGGLAGAILGVATAVVVYLSGASPPPELTTLYLQVAGGLLGVVVAVLLFTVYIRWLLRARFGSLRLVLVRIAARGLAAGGPSEGAT